MEKALLMLAAWAVLALCVSANPAREVPKPVAEDCQGLLANVPSCLGDIISSFLRWNVHLSPSCCMVLREVTDSCFRIAFPFLPPSPFRKLFQDFCATNGHVLD